MKQSEINRLYREKMISGGYCPKCGDFLIPRKKTASIRGIRGEKLETGVSLECINPKCDYAIDLGDDAQVTERKTEADNSIGDKLYPNYRNVYHRDAFGSKDIVMCSGQIHRSFPKTVKRSSIIGMDLDKEGKGVIIEYFDEENRLRIEFLDEIRLIDE